MISQITNAVKENVKPENFTESEDYKKLDERIGEIEDSVAKNMGQAKPNNSGRSGGNVTDKYEHEDIGWGKN
jgi:hypothetical protein